MKYMNNVIRLLTLPLPLNLQLDLVLLNSKLGKLVNSIMIVMNFGVNVTYFKQLWMNLPTPIMDLKKTDILDFQL